MASRPAPMKPIRRSCRLSFGLVGVMGAVMKFPVSAAAGLEGEYKLKSRSWNKNSRDEWIRQMGAGKYGVDVYPEQDRIVVAARVSFPFRRHADDGRHPACTGPAIRYSARRSVGQARPGGRGVRDSRAAGKRQCRRHPVRLSARHRGAGRRQTRPRQHRVRARARHRPRFRRRAPRSWSRLFRHGQR